MTIRLPRLLAVLVLAAGLGVATAPAAHALDLEAARAQGLVGERYDGLIGPVQAGPEVQALVARINSERMEEMRRIAQQRGVPVSEVQKLVGQAQIQKVPAGTFVMTPSGEWRRK